MEKNRLRGEGEKGGKGSGGGKEGNGRMEERGGALRKRDRYVGES